MSEIRPKPISDELASLIKQAVEHVTDFMDVWGKAVTKAKGEGISEEELREIARPLLRQKLSTNQIRYLFHRDEEIKRSQENRDKQRSAAYVRTNDDKKELENSDSPPQETPEVQKAREMMPDLEEDEELAAKRLQKALEEIKTKDDLLSERDEKIKQLSEVVKKDSFKKATDVEGEKYELVIDGINTEHFKAMDIGLILSKVISPLRNRGWKKVEIWVRNAG